MKLKILSKAYAKAEVDLVKFKKDLSKHWDMEKAIKHNTKIELIDKRVEGQLNLHDTIWASLDWAGIMDCLSGNHDEVMKVNFYWVEHEDWSRYHPGKIKNGQEVELLEDRGKDKGTLLVQSLVPDRNFDIKGFMKNGCYRYGSTDKLFFAWTREE